MSSVPKSMFVRDGDVFVAQDPARGPWSTDYCHAGPVTGLLARELECLVLDKKIVRLLVDLIRPVPVAGVRTSAQVTKAGRQTTTATAELCDLDGKVCARASSLHIVHATLGDIPTAPAPELTFSEARHGSFPIGDAVHKEPFFGNFVQIAFPPGESNEPGPTTLWMKTLPLLPDEKTTSFQRLCPLADCGNATSRNGELDRYSFVNPDITIVAHRDTDSEWLASTARSDWQSSGIGLSTAVIQDE
ncbi:MAG: thioesterase family protein, partial [Pseudomonadota bacterium]